MVPINLSDEGPLPAQDMQAGHILPHWPCLVRESQEKVNVPEELLFL